MRILPFVSSPNDAPRLDSERIYLRVPTIDDHKQWSTLRRDSIAFLRPWEPVWGEADLSRSAFRERLRQYNSDLNAGRALPYYLFRSQDHALLGGVTLSNIRQGISRSCTLGYWMGEPFAGQGFMKEALCTLVPHVFDTLNLHRIEAASIPTNQRSMTLLESCGFIKEGLARKYLKINGQWQDHILYALLRDDPRPTRVHRA
ncbi:MAG: GNAT family protein [Pseudomonadota bacterium]